jgi:hypothetical protein
MEGFMRGLRLVWAALAGWMVDSLLTTFIVGGGYALAGIDQPSDLNFTQPVHILVGLILPVVMTMIGGGVAGAMAPLDPTPAGALVGGIGLLMMAAGEIDMDQPHALAFIIAQCVAVFGAAAVATIVAHRRRSRI